MKLLQVSDMFEKQQSGFSLIELMVVVAIIGILSSIAYPSYLEYVRKARRSDAQQHLMALAQQNQQYFIDQRAYASTPSTLLATPTSVSTYYTLAINVNAGPPASFSIDAVPTTAGGQNLDACGTLTIASSGARTASSGTSCW